MRNARQKLETPGRSNPTLQLCRDPRYDVVVETALVGRANYLVSRDDDVKGDEELVQAMERRGVLVLSLAQFLELIQANAEQS